MDNAKTPSATSGQTHDKCIKIVYICHIGVARTHMQRAILFSPLDDVELKDSTQTVVCEYT